MADRPAAKSERVRLLFDAKADDWPTKYAPNGPLTGRLTQLADVLGYHVSANGCVLDLGCGTGELARQIVSTGLRVTGCDISRNMLCRAAAGDRGAAVEWLQLDPSWICLPFRSGSYDAVVAASVLEYVDSPGAVLAECARVLRPGGVLLCTVPDLSHPVRWLEWLASLASQVPPLRAVGDGWPRLDRYLTYLQISRQRRPARWWSATAARAGLIAVPQPAGPAEHAPLRLFTFQRPAN